MSELHEHPPGEEWSEPMKDWRSRIKWRFVLISWLIALTLTIMVTGLLGWATLALQSDTDTTGTGIVSFIAGFATFLVFFGVMFTRLQHIDHDRLLNSIAVALLHTFVSLGLGMIAIVVRASLDINSPIPGGRFEEMGTFIFSLDRPAAAALVACGLAAAIMPARGPLPTGTQTKELPTDRQL